MIQRGVEHVRKPIVPNATHSVECSCGYRADVVAPSDSVAVNEMILRHQHPGASFIAQKIEK